MIPLAHDVLIVKLFFSYEFLFFMRIVDALLYHKFVHPWHGGGLLNTCVDPHSVMLLLLSGIFFSFGRLGIRG